MPLVLQVWDAADYCWFHILIVTASAPDPSHIARMRAIALQKRHSFNVHLRLVLGCAE
jgi:hypothetical protein